MGDNFRRDHHYVSQVYLKRWAPDGRQIWTYPTLVSHTRVPIWKEKSLRGVAYHAHLYTRVTVGGDSDEVERWLDREFEAPAEDALQKATSGARMTPEDWRRLVRFAAAQDVRTTARLIESLERWNKEIPVALEESLREGIRKLEVARESGTLEELAPRRRAAETSFPVRLMTGIEPGTREGWIKASVTLGRQFWLAQIQHLLTSTINSLPQRGWTILSPPEGLTWFTSDNPVIRLNFYGDGTYDFGGGWGNRGSEILFPLSPHDLLYTQINKPTPRRGEALPLEKAKLVRRFIAEHAHRMIFAAEPDPSVLFLRPREVDAERFRSEREQWERWHEDQSEAEQHLVRN